MHTNFYYESLQPTPSDELETVDDVRQYMDGDTEVLGEVSTGAILVSIAILLESMKRLHKTFVETNELLERESEK